MARAQSVIAWAWARVGPGLATPLEGGIVLQGWFLREQCFPYRPTQESTVSSLDSSILPELLITTDKGIYSLPLPWYRVSNNLIARPTPFRLHKEYCKWRKNGRDLGMRLYQKEWGVSSFQRPLLWFPVGLKIVSPLCRTFHFCLWSKCNIVR